jgi:protein SCO1/2
MTGWLRHPLFAPVLALVALGWGIALNVFLVAGPSLGGWATSVLTLCFGWNAATHAYRLDAVLLAALEPPLFALVVAAFYPDELRRFLARRSGRAAGGAVVAGFAAATLGLVLSGDIVAGARTASAGLPPRDGRPAPRAALLDHLGRPFELGAPRGRPVVLTFVYTNCHSTCPALIATLRSAAARVGDRAVFAAVTLDPERDTVRALADAAERFGLTGDWHLLTGSRPAVDQVLAAYGVRVVRRGREVAHENVVVVLDGAGRVAFTYRGLGLAVDELARALDTLARERA